MARKKTTKKYPVSSKGKTEISLLHEVVKLIKGQPKPQSIMEVDAEVRAGKKKYDEGQKKKYGY